MVKNKSKEELDKWVHGTENWPGTDLFPSYHRVAVEQATKLPIRTRVSFKLEKMKKVLKKKKR